MPPLVFYGKASLFVEVTSFLFRSLPLKGKGDRKAVDEVVSYAVPSTSSVSLSADTFPSRGRLFLS